MFENVDGRTDGRTTDGRTTDGRTTDAGVTGILIAHLRAFGSGELKIEKTNNLKKQKTISMLFSLRFINRHLAWAKYSKTKFPWRQLASKFFLV